MTVEEAIKKLQKARTKLKKQGCSDIVLNIEAESYKDYGGMRTEQTVELTGKRPETDEEQSKRVDLERDREARWERERREKYEQLKKEFEAKKT